MLTSPFSVRVSWDSLEDIPEVTGYIVYYSQTGNSETEKMVRVSGSENNSVLIGMLLTGAEYQFEVVVELDGKAFTGERSTAFIVHLPSVSASPPSKLRPTCSTILINCDAQNPCIAGAILGSITALIIAIAVVVTLIVLLYLR